MKPEDIRKTRERHDMSRHELASLLGVSPSAVAKWETGERYPAKRHVEAIGDLASGNSHRTKTILPMLNELVASLTAEVIAVKDRRGWEASTPYQNMEHNARALRDMWMQCQGVGITSEDRVVLDKQARDVTIYAITTIKNRIHQLSHIRDEIGVDDIIQTMSSVADSIPTNVSSEYIQLLRGMIVSYQSPIRTSQDTLDRLDEDERDHIRIADIPVR